MLFHQDQDGNENHHIFIADTDHPDDKPVDLTPFEETKAWVHQVLRSDPNNILIQQNSRDKKVFDLYLVNTKTKEQTLIAENPGNVSSWITDEDGSLRGRMLKSEGTDPDKYWIFEIQTAKDVWDPVMSWKLDEEVSVLGFTPENNGVWLLSNRDRNRTSLTRLNLSTREETLVYEDSHVDLDSVYISKLTKMPLVADAYSDY